MNYLKKLRSKILLLLTHEIAVPMLMFGRRKKSIFIYSMSELETFEEGTLGKDLVEYLKKKNFKLQKNYERHDCKHILFAYEMDELGEAGMQFYFLGNGVFTIATVSSVLAYCVFMPENMKYYLSEYRKGKRKREGKTDLNKQNFNVLVTRSTNELRKQFNID